MSAQVPNSAAPADITTGFHRVGSLAQLRANGRLIAEIDADSVLVFEVEGSLVATSGACPHAGGPIQDGALCGAILSCPWHGYSFDLRTGACEEDAGLSLERYEVCAHGDDVLVRL
jgi:nitrite reductase (NADH) small subunit